MRNNDTEQATRQGCPQVIVVGAGPVGLMLAGELRLRGVDVVVLERLTAPTTESRASTLHARTMEILDQRGLLDTLGMPPRGGFGHFGGLPLDLSVPSRYAGQWKVPQARVEELLHDWGMGLGVDLRRGHELVGLGTRPDSVEADVSGPDGNLRLRAHYLVGCDGEQSTVRRLGGFESAGDDASLELLRADVAHIDVPNRRFERLPRGLAIASRDPGGITRVMVHEYGRPFHRRSKAPTFSEVVRTWARVTGEDISGGTPLWVNAFGNVRRQVSQYRRDRILLAGDAAHQQMPVGGQALNLGIQDAVNLGWKLAAQTRGRAPSDLLDTYHAERHAVGARVLTNIAAQATLLLAEDADPLRDIFVALLGSDDVRTGLAGMISGVDIVYDVGPGDHPLMGRAIPHFSMKTAEGTVTTADLLRSGCGVLLSFTGDAAVEEAASCWAGRVRAVHALPGTAAPAPGFTCALIRPDGHIVWVDGDPAARDAALRRWFGKPHRA